MIYNVNVASISITRRARGRLAGARAIGARKPVLFGVKYISILNQGAIAKPRCKIACAINILFFERETALGSHRDPTLRKRSKLLQRKETSAWENAVFSSHCFFLHIIFERRFTCYIRRHRTNSPAWTPEGSRKASERRVGRMRQMRAWRIANT